MFELKNCPFCRRQPGFVEKGGGTLGSKTFVKYYIECPNCKVSTPSAIVYYSFDPVNGPMANMDELDKLVTTWNTREGET